MITLGQSWVCPEEDFPNRIDVFLAEQLPDCSRSQIQAWLKKGYFELNGKTAKKNSVLKSGDKIEVVREPEKESLNLEPENIPLDIIYEDASLAIINKPKGMVVHPGHGNTNGTMVNALLYHFKNLSQINEDNRPGIIHRLDKDTSGLLVVAKTDVAHRKLAGQLEKRIMKRQYRAIAWRPFVQISGSIDRPIGRDPKNPTLMAVRPEGRYAVTHYKALHISSIATELELNLETGRTHQIRVHLSSLGHPVAGDTDYGGKPYSLDGILPPLRPKAAALQKIFSSQALHAESLSFLHPENGRSMEFKSPLPEELQSGIDYIRNLENY